MHDGRGLRHGCVVCGIETKRHAGWFLVAENYWLDRVKILSWHPVLARAMTMRSVCGKAHLKALLTHWVLHANLQLVPRCLNGSWRSPLRPLPSTFDHMAISSGRVLCELAVQRDARAPLWTGSQEALDCMLDALLGETETRVRGLELSSLERLVGYSQDYELAARCDGMS